MPLTLAVLMVFGNACMKDFLDIKREKTQVVPVNLKDYQALLDDGLVNLYYPYLLGEIGSDDYFITEDQWLGLSNPVHQNAYIWADDVYQGERGEDWNRGYEKILYANFVLEGVNSVKETSTNKQLRDELIGAAHFYRGTQFFLLTQLFCKQYDKATAHEDLGLPLRTSSNINLTYQRSTLDLTYRQIVADLDKAIVLLPNQMSVNTRPWRAAAYAMLANVYLQMGDYQSAYNNADKSLNLASYILNYNELDVGVDVPFPRNGEGNKEVIFYSQMDNAPILNVTRLNIDSVLYDTYSKEDLRKQAFFRVNPNVGINTFKGHYSGISAFMFSGLTTVEMLLVRMECSARLGNIGDSIADLNLLHSHRLAKDYFEPILDNDIPPNELLGVVLSERRKELIFRGRRWHDLKRFSKDANLARSLSRVFGDEVYTLASNSPKWVWPIPPDAIIQGNYLQNER